MRNDTQLIFPDVPGPRPESGKTAMLTKLKFVIVVAILIGFAIPQIAVAQFQNSRIQTQPVRIAQQATASEAANQLDGDVENIKHVISKFGFQFGVSFEQIRYQAEIHSIDVVRRDAGRVHVRVLLKHLQLTVDRTEINGKRHHALCGPFEIRIGAKRNVAVDFLFQTDGKNSVRLVDSQFNLDRNNWTIGRPRSIQVRGFGMTQNRVATELKNGLNNNVGIVEAKILDQLPAAYESIAERVSQVIEASKIASNHPTSGRTTVVATK